MKPGSKYLFSRGLVLLGMSFLVFSATPQNLLERLPEAALFTLGVWILYRRAKTIQKGVKSYVV